MNLDNQPCAGPADAWGLDPLFWVPVKLFVGDLPQALASESASVFFVGNRRAVRSVELVGIVVSADTRSAKMDTYAIDDGTGVALCVHFASQDEQSRLPPPPRLEYSLGDTVRVEGRLVTFRGERQVVVRNMWPAAPDDEAAGWLERLTLRRLLSAPVSGEEQQSN